MKEGMILKIGGSGGSGKRTARFVIGTSEYGWTADDCDYLCDGISDDVEINAAIQALPNMGGEIILLDGSYFISAPIVLNKYNVVLRGNGKKTEFYRKFDGDKMVYLYGSYGVVENLSIDGVSYAYPSTSNKGIYALTTNNVVRNCTIQNEAGYGIHFAAENNKAIGNTVTDCDEGIYADDDQNIISNNIVLNCTSYGIHVCDSHNVITGNISRLNESANLYVYYSDHNIITGNNFAVVDGDSVTPYAIRMSGTGNKNNIITDNVVGVGEVITSGSDNIVGNPAYTYGTSDLTAGTSELSTGHIYLVYE